MNMILTTATALMVSLSPLIDELDPLIDSLRYSDKVSVPELIEEPVMRSPISPVRVEPLLNIVRTYSDNIKKRDVVTLLYTALAVYAAVEILEDITQDTQIVNGRD
jgi:hypothetical protein